LRKLQDSRFITQPQQWASVSGSEQSISYHLADSLRELENPESIGDGRPIFPYQLCNGLLGMPKFGNEPIVTFGFFHRIQIAPL